MTKAVFEVFRRQFDDHFNREVREYRRDNDSEFVIEIRASDPRTTEVIANVGKKKV